MINKLWPFALLATSLISPSVISEEQDWWFDVEVILFSRDAEQVDEVFEPVVKPIDVHRSTDLLTAYLAPDLSYLQQMLPACQASERFPMTIFRLEGNPLWDPDLSNSTVTPVILPYWFAPPNWQQLTRLDCLTEQNEFAPKIKPPLPTEVPVHISGISQRYPVASHLLSGEQLELNSIYQQLNRLRGVQPMLHVGWRQQVVFGRDNAKAIRLFAGHNYSDQFDYWGNQLAPEPINSPLLEAADTQPHQNLVERIELALKNDALPAIIKKKEEFVQQEFSGQIPAQVWQLDGLFKVYLQYINRVPYLHIDSQFNYRKPDALDTTLTAQTNHLNGPPEQFLYSYPFKQLRRVISQEIHYFDHPYIGMIVQIRRYHIPAPPKEE